VNIPADKINRELKRETGKGGGKEKRGGEE
jgi:hypothetical protein